MQAKHLNAIKHVQTHPSDKVNKSAKGALILNYFNEFLYC